MRVDTTAMAEMAEAIRTLAWSATADGAATGEVVEYPTD